MYKPLNIKQYLEEQKKEALVRSIEKKMLKNHNIAMGCWGIPAGAKTTITRMEFFGKALELKEITEEEYNTLRIHLGRGWTRDLSE